MSAVDAAEKTVRGVDVASLSAPPTAEEEDAPSRYPPARETLPLRGAPYDELEAEMVVGDLEADPDTAAIQRPRYGQAVLRADAQEIVNGALGWTACAR